MNTFHLPTRVHHGSDALGMLSRLEGERVLVVTDPFMARAEPMARVLQLLTGCATTVFDQVEANPGVQVVTAATRSLLDAAPDLVLAVGGGSSIDTAKAVLKVARDHDLQVRHGLWVVPTTSGSGSEVTSFAVITEESEHLKVPLVSPDMVPEVAILDATAVATAPPRITADTGMDVATHAIEAYLNAEHSDFSDALAEKAIQLVCTWLPRCFSHGEDMVARQHMHNASCLAGMAFENSGLGITHSLAHAIGGHFPVAHGRLNAILLPHTLAWNARDEQTAERIAWLGHLVGVPATGRTARVHAFIRAVRQLESDLQIGPRITDHGVGAAAFRAEIPRMAAAALDDGCTPGNPVQPTVADLEQLLRKLL